MIKLNIDNPVERLFKAIDCGDTEQVLALIVYDRSILKSKNRNGLTPLMDAVIGKQYDVIQLLLLHEVDVNQRDEDGWTAKSWAIFIQDKKSQSMLSKVSVLCDTDNISGALWGSMI